MTIIEYDLQKYPNIIIINKKQIIEKVNIQ